LMCAASGRMAEGRNFGEIWLPIHTRGKYTADERTRWPSFR
jgi:hypothetical protein